MISSFTRASLLWRLSRRRSSLASISSWTRAAGGSEAYGQSTLACSKAETEGDMSLAGAAVADDDDVVAALVESQEVV